MPSGDIRSKISMIVLMISDRIYWINVAVMGLRGTFAPSVTRLYRAVLFPNSPFKT